VTRGPKAPFTWRRLTDAEKDGIADSLHRADSIAASVAAARRDSVSRANGRGPVIGPAPNPPPAPNPSPAPNPQPPGAQVQFLGAITAILGSNLIVAGRTVQTIASTLVQRGGDPVSFARLQVGQVVEVRGSLQPDGSVLANSITIVEDPGEEVTARGIIASLTIPTPTSSTGVTLTVAGRTIRTNASTVVRRRGDPAGFDRMRVGQEVEVKGLLQADGSILATRITLEED
jgi:hypothetical protein